MEARKERKAVWVTEVLADYVSSLRAQDLTQEARGTAKKCIMDLLGAAASGFSIPSARAMRSTAARFFAQGSSTVWFSGQRSHEAAAAMVNSAAASALDMDDGHRSAGGHPGASIIPAAMAVAEQTGARGEDLLAAIAVGYEVGVRVASARDFTSLDTLSTGRWCSYGAAAAGGFLKKLPPKVLAEALAVAGVLSPGLSAAGYSSVMGNSVKEGIPWATLTGLMALELAQAGFTGPADILDHPSYYDGERILRGLGRGQGFAIEKVYFKPYSCCRWIHSALDAFLWLTDRHGIEPGEISRIHVHTFGRALRLNNYPDPDSLEGAQYSIPFSLAVAALQGKSALLPMTTRCLRQPEIVALAGKVELHVDPELDTAFPAKTSARLVVETKRGNYERLVEDALGDHANPLEQHGLEEKYRKLTTGILSPREQSDTLEAIAHIETGGLPRLFEVLGSARTFGIEGLRD